MTRRATPPFRADHVGSLLRPAELLAARDDFAAGTIDAARLTAVEDAAISGAVRLQEGVGLQSATDGEFRREQWHADFLYAIGGIDRGALGAPLPVYTRDGEISWTPNVTEITGKVHLEAPIFGDHFTFLRETVTTAAPKITVPSPSMAHFRVDLSKSPYSGYEEFRADVAATYADEVAALYELGCRYLQFDDTIFAFLYDPAWRANASATGIDPDRQHEINVDVINSALAGKPTDMAVTVHMCRGNYRSARFSSGGYDFVAEHVDLDRLCISGQCGFVSTVEGNALTIDEERAKLELLVETAAEVWG
jgi:5-methyltetrahydropteroyltriglutamate--homocysteine methyltransferase